VTDPKITENISKLFNTLISLIILIMHTFCAFFAGTLCLLTLRPKRLLYQQSYPQPARPKLFASSQIVTALLKTRVISVIKPTSMLRVNVL
jgi:hypothetical protein